MSDLRAFLATLAERRKSDLLVVERPVSPRYETAAIVAKLEANRRSPVVRFDQVEGTRFPVVSNVCGSEFRMALALGCGRPQLAETYKRACDAPIAPARVDEAPVYDNLATGDDVDLSILPPLVYHEHDSDKPYITSAIVVARDPETKKTNLSYHRLMIEDRHRTGICIEPGKHLDGIHQKYVARGEPMPIAVFIGAHPAWSIGTLYSGDADVEEYDIIGGLLGAPLEVTDCRTQPDLQVPARAEFVLEGYIPPDEVIPEGPFGEFTGYGTGETESPVFHVTALAHRDDAIYQDVVSGHLEHLILPTLAIEHRAWKVCQKASDRVTALNLAAPLTTIVAIDKTDDAQPKTLIEKVLQSDIYTKHVIVVDHDVDVNNLQEVLRAVALHTQADEKTHILTNVQGSPLDPSSRTPDGIGAKMGIDATQAIDGPRAVTKNQIKADVWDAIDIDALLGRKKKAP